MNVDKHRIPTMTSHEQQPVAPHEQSGVPTVDTDRPRTQRATDAKRRVWRRLQHLLRHDPEFNPKDGPQDRDAPGR